MIKAALPFGLLVEIFIRYILINRTVSPDPVEVGTVVIFLTRAEESLRFQPRDDVVFGKTATTVTRRGSEIAAAKRPKQRSTVQVGERVFDKDDYDVVRAFLEEVVDFALEREVMFWGGTTFLPKESFNRVIVQSPRARPFSSELATRKIKTLALKGNFDLCTADAPRTKRFCIPKYTFSFN
jgi:hypothetical protein